MAQARTGITAALAARTTLAWVVDAAAVLSAGLSGADVVQDGTAGDLRAAAVLLQAHARELHDGADRSDYLLYAQNSLITSVFSTVLGLAIAAPAAYSMAFFRSRYTRDILMWMLSTKMMPAVGALVPIYVLAQTAGMLDTRTALVHRLHAVEPADHGVDAVLALQGHPARDPRSRTHGRRHAVAGVRPCAAAAGDGRARPPPDCCAWCWRGTRPSGR